MTLSQTQGQRKASGQSKAVTSIATYPTPIVGLRGEEFVSITHSGEVEGMSPAYQVITKDGQTEWVSQSEVRIVDFAFLPPGRESLETLSEVLNR